MDYAYSVDILVGHVVHYSNHVQSTIGYSCFFVTIPSLIHETRNGLLSG